MAARFSGRPPLRVLSATAGYALAHPARMPLEFGSAGLRYDYYGKVFHLSLGAKAGGTRTTSVADFELIQAPLVDLTLGGAAVISPVESFRIHLGLGVGVWSLLYPSARATLGINIANALMLTVSGGAHYDYEHLESISSEYLFYSGEAGLGFVF
jgi:hypothetical protein